MTILKKRAEFYGMTTETTDSIDNRIDETIKVLQATTVSRCMHGLDNNVQLG